MLLCARAIAWHDKVGSARQNATGGTAILRSRGNAAAVTLAMTWKQGTLQQTASVVVARVQKLFESLRRGGHEDMPSARKKIVSSLEPKCLPRSKAQQPLSRLPRQSRSLLLRVQWLLLWLRLLVVGC